MVRPQRLADGTWVRSGTLSKKVRRLCLVANLRPGLLGSGKPARPRQIATLQDYDRIVANEDDGLCQHPTIREAGVCERQALDTIDVPIDYTPPERHSRQFPIPRPQCRVCRQHMRMIQAHVKGLTTAGNSHVSWCDVCNHPHGERVCDLWTRWLFTTNMAVAELGVSHSTFYNHVHWAGLYEVKASKVNINRVLTMAAEKGFEAGGHNVQTALKAVGLLIKERGDPQKVEVKGFVGVGVVDLTKLTNAQLAEQLEAMSRQLRESEVAKLVLTDGRGSSGGDYIDVVATPVEPEPVSVPVLAPNVESGDDG